MGIFFTVCYMRAQRIVFFGWRESLFSVLVTEPVSWLWLHWGVSEVLSQRMVTANMVPSNLRLYLIMRNASLVPRTLIALCESWRQVVCSLFY